MPSVATPGPRSRAATRGAPRAVIVARVTLTLLAFTYLPVATVTAFVLGGLAHFDVSSGWGTAWALHTGYALVGALIGIIGSLLMGVTAVSMGQHQTWTRILGLILAGALTLTGFVIPGIILVVCLLDRDAGQWLAAAEPPKSPNPPNVAPPSPEVPPSSQPTPESATIEATTGATGHDSPREHLSVRSTTG